MKFKAAKKFLLFGLILGILFGASQINNTNYAGDADLPEPLSFKIK